MKNYIIIILLFVISICFPSKNPNNERSIEILECISKSEGISEDIKNFIVLLMKTKKSIPIVSNKMKMKNSDIEIIKACKTAQLHDFIMSLPKGYDTMVGEGGVTLSGGERQRLAIARALIKKTEIILFDEATSALDNETQEKIATAIHNLKGKYTILIIAHRLSTVINSDKIFLIEKGKIIGTGTHNELLKNNKKYQKLYQADLLQEEKLN